MPSREEKKITIRLDKNTYEYFKRLFPGDSDYHAAGVFFEEQINCFVNTINEVKKLDLFDDEDLQVLLALTQLMSHSFTSFRVRETVIHLIEKYISQNTGLQPGSEKQDSTVNGLIKKIETLTEYQCYVLIRQLQTGTHEFPDEKEMLDILFEYFQRKED